MDFGQAPIVSIFIVNFENKKKKHISFMGI